MVEGAVFLQPLLAIGLVPRVYQGTVDKLKVLRLALCRYEGVRLLEHGLVASQDTEPKPALLDFGVLRIGEMIVIVNPRHDIGRNLLLVLSELV